MLLLNSVSVLHTWMFVCMSPGHFFIHHSGDQNVKIYLFEEVWLVQKEYRSQVKSSAKLVLEKVDPSAVLALKRMARPRCKSEKSPSTGEFIQCNTTRDRAQVS